MIGFYICFYVFEKQWYGFDDFKVFVWENEYDFWKEVLVENYCILVKSVMKGCGDEVGVEL